MKILQISITVILSFSLIISIHTAFAENKNNTNSNLATSLETSDTNVPRGGFIQILFATDPKYPDSTDQTNLEFDFVNKENNSIQQDVDYKISINQSLQDLNSTTTTLQQSNSISTDRGSYGYGDTISITGTFSNLYNNTILNFFILNPDQEAVSNHGFIAGSDGKFDALVVATGPKWNLTGTYTVILKSSQGTIAQKSFSFSGREIPTPEFGSMVGIISICAIIGMIMVSRKFNYRIL